MNASASALTREGEVQSKIRKVRMFGRTARVVCSALFGFGLVGSAAMLMFNVVGIFMPLPDGGTGFTTEQKIWALPIGAAVIGSWLAMVYQLYRLFGNLATGAIYTPENVRRVRYVGLLLFLLAALAFLIPLASHALGAVGITVPVESAWVFPGMESLSSFVSAGLVLLASWIMDVGLYEKDHADELKRESDLVI